VSVRWAQETAFAAKPSLRWAISLAGAVLIASILGVPSASAAPLEKAADAVGPVVPPLTAISPPSLPSRTPPQLPASAAEAPVKAPAAPRVPPVTAPTGEVRATTPNSSASGPGVDPSSIDEIASGAFGSAGTSTEEAQQAASARSGGGRGSGRHGVPPSGIEAGSIESATLAPPRLLLAYVWPAIALGSAGELLGALQARWEAATSLPVSDVPRLLPGLTGAAHVAGLSARSTPNPSSADSRDIRIPSGGAISLLVLIVAGAALMALLVFTLRREFRSMHRWPL
jgi:hypothetical protein